MLNRKQIEHNIEKQKDLPEMIPAALNIIGSDYYSYSVLQFSMHLYNYYEMTCEKQVEETDTIFSMILRVAERMMLHSFDGQAREEAVREIDAVRTDILGIMHQLTAYTDRFAIYEYILNRLEKNYEDELEDIDNDAVTKDIMQAIFADKDQVAINSKIRAMLSQLPIRMTKNRFFDMLNDSLSIYEGSDLDSVDDFIYMIRTASGLDTDKGTAVVATPETGILSKYLGQLETMNLTMMSKEDFKQAQDILALAVEKIQAVTDRYYSLQEVVNAFYCALLNQPYASREAENEVSSLLDILQVIVEQAKKGTSQSLEDAIVDKFESTEGKLETLSEYISKDEGTLDVLEQSNRELMESLMLNAQYTALQLSKKLTGNSSFIDLHAQKKEGTADKAYLSQQFNELTKEYLELLGSHHKLYNRAVIAAALRELPVLFKTMQEVEDYVKGALAGCHDVSEKIASIELFQSACE